MGRFFGKQWNCIYVQYLYSYPVNLNYSLSLANKFHLYINRVEWVFIKRHFERWAVFKDSSSSVWLNIKCFDPHTFLLNMAVFQQKTSKNQEMKLDFS
jgi:hypothetical protein